MEIVNGPSLLLARDVWMCGCSVHLGALHRHAIVCNVRVLRKAKSYW